MLMIQQEKPQLACTMPVVWPTLLDLGRDECKRILRKLELEAYAGVISALRAQGDLTKDKKDLLGELTKVLSISTERHRAEVRRAVNDERLTTIAYHMSGPNSSSEWSIEGRRLVPLMPRLVPQTAFTVTANAVASATANQNASLLLPAETGNKEVVVCYSYTSTTSTSATAPSGSAAAMVKSPRPASPASNMVVLPSGSTVYVKSVSCSDEDEKPRKRRRTNSSSSSPVVLKEVAKVTPPMSKTITVPVSGSPKMSNIMQSIANSLPPHMSPVKITFTKPTTQTTNTTTQKVIIVTTSPSSNFVPNILSKSHSHNYAAAMSKLVSTSMLTSANQKQTVLIPASSSPSSAPNTVAVTTMVSSSPSVVMSTIAQGGSSTGMKVASARLPSPKTMVGSPTQILAQFPKQHQQSPKQLQQGSPMGAGVMGQAQSSTTLPGSKPTIQIKQESGVKIITQQMQPSKILPKPSSVGMSSSSSSPIMVVSSNGAIMTTKLVSQPTGTQATYSRPTVSPSIGARMATSTSGATYVKTTSGSIITVVPKSLATLGGKIISSNIVSGTTTKITTIPMTSKPNVIVVQKATGKATTIQGLPGKNVVTTLLNAGGEKTLQGVPGSKPAIITASRPITKMIVTQPKGMGSGVQPNTTTKIIPTKIVYGQQGKTQVLIKPKPIFQTAVLSEQTRQLVSETLQQASRVADAQEGALKDESGGIAEGSFQPADGSISSSHDSQPVVHIISSRGQEWAEQHEVSVESGPTIIYQDVSTGNVTQSATSTIKALLELQQTTVKDKGEAKPRQHTIDLSQMAVPFQMAQDKKQQDPVSPGTSTVETEPSTEYITAVKASRAGPSSGGDMVMSASQQLTASSQSTGHTPMVVKSIPTSSAVTVTRIVQLASEGQLIHSKQAEEMVMEEGELEGDTLDPQTGLFYRSIQLAAAPAPQHHTLPQPQSQSHSEPQSEQGRHMPHSTQPMPHHTQPPQLHSKPQMSQPSSTLVKKPPQLQEQYQPKPQAPGQSLKERPSSASGSPQLVGLGTPTKPPSLTPQLPKLQQAPTSHHRPIHTQLSQPPPLQAHHPVGADKTPSTSLPPIITQGASITKITFGGSSSHQSPPVSSSGEATAKLVPAEPSSSGPSGGEKPSVSDILKISMMEAEIDPSAEPMVVDSSSDCSPYGKGVGAGGDLGVLGGSGPVISSSGASLHHSSHSKPQHSQFSRIQGLVAKGKEDLDVIEVIPRYSIMPDSSQSNVVVEPSGFLEISNYTSQRLDEESVMEQEVDSSNDEATTVSPMEGCADQSQ
ncbi:BRCA2-interacting transcriptional repressor EMSY isoform X3 [Oncorhynchus tshawytscha]|uniref:BRCA2-interacting transcriptional repressor EMSY n=1 Tax=Oncorhynchus tshawytscha TaxID=74940 RepID=A0A8C8G190_ONCTS|nr:BRCA2-interacting transcriptional repressor EMSY isoform X2 [Oncorhynchus tshawytscha]XP_024249351.1 BRCA2-interacting transcriptional repressor EMSY isoform X2 [Oncorhynchus tshawytscha]XP_024249352.1 BRCA2-interacting transcriptional repressor EMSY isoform X3 [Oncorhynchus tshawytscha]